MIIIQSHCFVRQTIKECRRIASCGACGCGDVLTSRYREGRCRVAVGVGHHRRIANKGFALPEKAIWIREKLYGVRGVWFRAAERAASRGENRRWRSGNWSTKVGET